MHKRHEQKALGGTPSFALDCYCFRSSYDVEPRQREAQKRSARGTERLISARGLFQDRTEQPQPNPRHETRNRNDRGRLRSSSCTWHTSALLHKHATARQGEKHLAKAPSKDELLLSAQIMRAARQLSTYLSVYCAKPRSRACSRR